MEAKYVKQNENNYHLIALIFYFLKKMQKDSISIDIDELNDICISGKDLLIQSHEDTVELTMIDKKKAH